VVYGADFAAFLVLKALAEASGFNHLRTPWLEIGIRVEVRDYANREIHPAKPTGWKRVGVPGTCSVLRGRERKVTRVADSFVLAAGQAGMLCFGRPGKQGRNMMRPYKD